MSADSHAAIEAVWRLEAPRLTAGLMRLVRDLGAAEDLAHDALVAALEQWPSDGVPRNPGAWLMQAAKHRAVDLLRRRTRLDRKHDELARELDEGMRLARRDPADALDDDIGDDLLRLMFIACHPVLSAEARVALTLRLLGGLTTDEIARAYLVPEATIAQRIVRAKKTLAKRRVPFEVPAPAERMVRAGLGARGDLPRVQRGLRGDRPARTGSARRCATRRCASAACWRRSCPRRARRTGWSR